MAGGAQNAERSRFESGQPHFSGGMIIMAGKKTKHGSVKRFGPRYGRTLKNKTGHIESLQKKSYACPKCHYERVKQNTTGIWECSKCDAKFTSKAFTITKLPTLKVVNKED